MSKESLHELVAGRTVTVRGRESVPVDRTAARVIGPGVQFEPDKRLAQEIWDIAPRCVTAPTEVEDLTGTRRGRMRIVGYRGSRRLSKQDGKANGRKHLWLARCDCGKFEERNGAAWRKGMRQGDPDLCSICRHTMYLRRRDNWLRTGRNEDGPESRV